MIVWLASFPRSGNTFLRIVLHRLYGLPTYSIYDDDDPVAQRVGVGLVGYSRKPPSREEMVESSRIYFTKTHKRPKNDAFPAIYLVRDGRDALVSLAHRCRVVADQQFPLGHQSGSLRAIDLQSESGLAHFGDVENVVRGIPRDIAIPTWLRDIGALWQSSNF